MMINDLKLIYPIFYIFLSYYILNNLYSINKFKLNFDFNNFFKTIHI